MALTKYQQRTAILLNDPGQQLWSLTSLTAFINEARSQIAAEGECIKVLPPGTNGVASITVTAGGSGYISAPTVTITGPGTGATATAVLTGDAVTSVTVDTAGSAYDYTTAISFSGGSGAGATAVPVINCVNTVAGQEVYQFSAVNPLAQLTAGVASILFISSVAVSWGALKPTLDQWNWDDLQAKVRAYPVVSGQPAMWAQFGQGVGGSIYLQPVPTTTLPMEWNCVCLPIDLATDSDPEAIPYPWTDAVPYFAAYVGFMNARRPEEAKNIYGEFELRMKRARAFSESMSVPSYYA
jgi:hypothetical protein